MSKLIVKQYIIRKYIKATSAAQALRKERNFHADECWVDDDWKKQNIDIETKTIGFSHKKTKKRHAR